MLHCSECGRDNREEARFCHYCGHPIEKVIAKTTDSCGVPENSEAQPSGGIEPMEKESSLPSETPGNDDTEASSPSLTDTKFLENQIVTLGKQEMLAALPSPDLINVPEEPIALPTLLPGEPPSPESSMEQRLAVAEPAADTRLEIGTVLQERYRILDVVPQETETTVYEAEDLRRCSCCQTIQTEVEPRFCENCGAELKEKPIVHLHETKMQEGVNEGMFSEGEHVYQVEVLATMKMVKTRPRRLQLIVGYQSDTGQERDIDEDSVLVLQLASLCETEQAPMLGFFAVADGLGGHEAGEVASQTAVRMLAASIMDSVLGPEMKDGPLSIGDLRTKVEAAALAANQAIFDLRKSSKMEIDMGCTLTAAFVRETETIVANVGDSRTYLMHEGKLSQVTQDHSVVAGMLAAGVIHSEEVNTHEQKGVIYRCLGDKPELEVDLFEISLVVGDRLLLCCDGLWEMVSDSIIEDVLLERSDPQSACDRLVELANQAGGEDNISVIVINLNALASF